MGYKAQEIAEKIRIYFGTELGKVQSFHIFSIQAAVHRQLINVSETGKTGLFCPSKTALCSFCKCVL
jgi:hypothetical protein